jgi:hypothetical protein
MSYMQKADRGGIDSIGDLSALVKEGELLIDEG